MKLIRHRNLNPIVDVFPVKMDDGAWGVNFTYEGDGFMIERIGTEEDALAVVLAYLRRMDAK